MLLTLSLASVVGDQPGRRSASGSPDPSGAAALTNWFEMARSKNITIRVPHELRAYCNGASLLMLSAPSVRAVLDELERRHPSLYRGICDDTGAVRRHVNLFVNKDHMRDRDGLDTALVPGDEIIILPAVSGG